MTAPVPKSKKSSRFKRFKKLFSSKKKQQEKHGAPSTSNAVFRPSWHPDDIFNELNGQSSPKELLNKKLLMQVGGVNHGWILDFTSSTIAIETYDLPASIANAKKAPSGPPSSYKDLKGYPWAWYKDLSTFNKIELGTLSEMKAFVTGKIAASGEMKPWDYIDSVWKEAKVIAEAKKREAFLKGDVETGLEQEEEEEEEEDVDEEARIIAMFKPEKEPMDPRTKAFWKRHFGTDMLVATYLYLISSVFFVVLSMQVLFVELAKATTEQIDPSTTAHYIGTAFMSIFFLIGNIYFIKMSYPETMMVMVYRVMTNDPAHMTFTQRYFTANEMLISIWMFMGAFIVPTILESIFELFFLGEWKHALMDLNTMIIGTVIFMPFMISSFPDCMRMNNGQGSTFTYDYLISPCLGLNKSVDSMKTEHRVKYEKRVEFWTKHLGNDMLAGAWELALMGVAAGIPSLIYFVTNPFLPAAISAFWSGMPFCLGSILMLHAMYPENMNKSIFFSDEDDESTEKSVKTASDSSQGDVEVESTPLLA